MRKILLNKLSVCVFIATSLTQAAPASPSENLWQALGKKMSLAAYSQNVAVQKKIRWYMAHQDVLHEFSQNAQPYIFYVSQQVEKNRLPMELAFLPMIESSYLPDQRSSAKAMGLWQLEPQTARGLGVHVNWWYDGRKDVVSSTHAALTYLNYLHGYFHNWPLALAAYNAGMGTVTKAIAYNKAHHLSTDYWSLPLPKETKDYVPKLLAVAAIFANPKAYNLAANPIPNKAVFSQVTVDTQMPLTRVAHLANTDINTLAKLNPGIKDRYATVTDSFNVLVPADKAQPLAEKLAEVKSNKTSAS